MLIFIILGTIGAFLGYLKRDREYSWKVNTLPIFVGLAIGLFAAFMTSCILQSRIPHVTQHHEFDRLQIVALGNSNEMQGDFFLGFGIINSRPTYSFYYLLSDGGKQLDTLDASCAVVYEENRDDAYLVKTGVTEVYSSLARLWFFPNLLFGNMIQGKYAIHVPKGTIKTGYKLGVN